LIIEPGKNIGDFMLNYKQAVKLTEETINWFFNCTSEDAVPFHKQSNKDPKYSDEIWARLMVDAISAFHQGLEDRIEPEGRTASNIDLYDSAIDMVGSDAFEMIAFLVAAAGSDRPKQELK